MDVDRELFIQQLVVALHENTALASDFPSLTSSSQLSTKANDAGSSSDSAEEDEKSPQEHTGLFLSNAFLTPCDDSKRLAKEAYMQLQFDYPQVQDASIEALAELYRRISTEKSMWQIAAEVPITATLLDGVAFLNRQSSFSSKNGTHQSQNSEASGLLAASLLLLVVRTCLETPDDARTDALLSSLRVNQLETTRRSGIETMQTTMKKDEDEFVEKFAVQEDSDDLSEVYKGHLPEPRSYCISTRNQQTRAISAASKAEKLQYLASYTFSSSFESVSMERWKQWHLDDNLVAIMKLLVDQELFPEAKNDKHKAAPTTLYGPRNEWTRYLYILRDRVLRFPGTSRNALWRLKELIEFLQRHQSVANAVNISHHLVYRVLAELAMSREFQQGATQRAQQDMALVIQELVPLIAQDIHQLVTAPKFAFTRQRKIVSEHKHDSVEICAGDDGDDELVMVVLQLLHFMLFASSNARTTTDKLRESGMLRTLLMLLPPTSGSNTEKHAQFQEKRWFPALLRLVGECALWHAGFSAYIARVSKFTAMFSALQEQLVVEQLILALAFHQHEVQIQITSASLNIDIWEVFTSELIFPLQCKSYLDAMKKLQDTAFILDCLEKVLAFLRPAMQKEFQCSLQQVYSSFGRSFEYPMFAVVVAGTSTARQGSSNFDPQSLDDIARDNSDSAVAHIGGRISSKLD
ncbi:unnamed protein product [Peronospora destructor]|uniref:Uncharacterized protein n=1 Tax=Peronospora destructor TaxID=86335 RepID=A0AAV0V9H1_9STRA|nr:unnamed protein product [Peronospora destructor]